MGAREMVVLDGVSTPRMNDVYNIARKTLEADWFKQ